MQWHVRNYAGSFHPRRVPYGTLVLHTTHTSEASVRIEVEASKQRMRRGELSKIEITDVGNGTVETVTPWDLQ
jgi:hypothetical protein